MAVRGGGAAGLVGYGLAGLVIVAWLLLQCPIPQLLLVDIDWGHQLGGANQILFGEHPFVDWHTDYGPLRYYPSALAQRLLGPRTGSDLVLLMGGYTLAYLVLFHLMWWASRRRAVAAVGLGVALLLMPGLSKYYMVLGPLLAL